MEHKSLPRILGIKTLKTYNIGDPEKNIKIPAISKYHYSLSFAFWFVLQNKLFLRRIFRTDFFEAETICEITDKPTALRKLELIFERITSKVMSGFSPVIAQKENLPAVG